MTNIYEIEPWVADLLHQALISDDDLMAIAVDVYNEARRSLFFAQESIGQMYDGQNVEQWEAIVEHFRNELLRVAERLGYNVC